MTATLLMEEEEITQSEHYRVWRNMVDYGGSFVRNLGKALMHADENNTRRIKEAFPDYWERFRNIPERNQENGAGKAAAALTLDPESRPCPCVKVGDVIETEIGETIVREMRYSPLQQGTCRSIKKLQLLLCATGQILNPGHTVTVDCSKCPIERGKNDDQDDN